MSVWFRSFITYGVNIGYDKLKELGIDPWEDDSKLMENNGANMGWAADGMNGDFAIYGYLVHEGEDNGNDSPLGGDGEAKELYLLDEEMKERVKASVTRELGIEYADKLKYYVVGEYS